MDEPRSGAFMFVMQSVTILDSNISLVAWCHSERSRGLSYYFRKHVAEPNIERCLDFARHDNRALNAFVLKMAFALQRLGVFVLAQNIFIELHVYAKKVLEPRFNSLSIL
jgi:hypothetical protein